MALSSEEQKLCNLLADSISGNNDKMKNAVAQLQAAEENAAYCGLLLKVVSELSIDLAVRLNAAIAFKNYIKRAWDRPMEQGGGIPLPLRAEIKESLVSQMMMVTNNKVRNNLSATVAFIAEADFPSEWPELLPELKQTIEATAGRGINADLDDRCLGALQTTEAVLQRYRCAPRSDSVLRELKGVLEEFQNTHLAMFLHLVKRLLLQDGTGARVSAVVLKQLESVLGIFLSLNTIDPPESYEDNAAAWFEGFMRILVFQASYQNCDESVTEQLLDDEEAGPLEKLQGVVCEACSLYANQYQEIIEPHIQELVSTFWGLLVRLDHRSRFDVVVGGGIKFLSAAIKFRWQQDPFFDEQALSQIAQRVIIPNIRLRDFDMEQFTENSLEFIRQDLEAADADTRRRAATELVKNGSLLHEESLTKLLLKYVQSLLSSSSQDIFNKDSAIFLITAIAAKTQTKALGATSVNPLVDVVAVFSNLVREELASTDPSRAIVRASAIRYLDTFRGQILTSNPAVAEVLPELCKQLVMSLQHGGKGEVVHCYAAHALYNILNMHPLGEPQTQQLLACVEPCLNAIKEVLLGSGGQKQPSEYSMRLIMKIFASTKGNASVLEKSIESLSLIIQGCNQLPGGGGPAFNHYLFESLSVVTLQLCVGGRHEVCDRVLIPVLSNVLSSEVKDFVPYCLQILALLLDASTTISSLYEHLLSICLEEPLWRESGNIPGLVRLFASFFAKNQNDVMGKLLRVNLEKILGRAQYCLSHRKMASRGMDIFNSLFRHMPPESFERHLTTIINLVLQSVQTSTNARRPPMLLDVALFFSILSFRGVGPALTLQALERVQPGLAKMVLKKLWVPGLRGVLSSSHRKLCCLALVRLLREGGVTNDSEFLNSILDGLEILLKVEGEAKKENVNFSQGELGLFANDTLAGENFEVGFQKLAYTELPGALDYAPEVTDYHSLVKQILGQLRERQEMAGRAALLQWVTK